MMSTAFIGFAVVEALAIIGIALAFVLAESSVLVTLASSPAELLGPPFGPPTNGRSSSSA